MTDRNRDLPKSHWYFNGPCVIGTSVWFCPEDTCKVEVMRSDNYCPRCGQEMHKEKLKGDCYANRTVY